MIQHRVTLKRARELLHERGDMVAVATLSRYVSKYCDALDPRKQGREVFIDFDALVQHRASNINMGVRGRPQAQRPARPSAAPTELATITNESTQRGRADEAALNIRAQRQMRELEIAERIGALTPTREVREAAVAAVAALRNSFALALNDSAATLANDFNLEARLVRPHFKRFEKLGLDAFARALVEKDLVGELDPDEGT